jgi:succinyl-diaminopimelate desuccinylase
MKDAKAQLLRWIDEDRESIVGFLCDFVRAKSPNPPGDTTLAAAHVRGFLEQHKLPFRVIAALRKSISRDRSRVMTKN